MTKFLNSSQVDSITAAFAIAKKALISMAAPATSCGTYVVSREGCGTLAAKALLEIENLGNFDFLVSENKVPPNQKASLSSQSATLMSSKFTVYSDGGCKGNPGPAGWGAVVLSAEGVVVREAKGFLGRATNQVAELQGALEGLKLTPVGAVVELVSDSQYTLKGLSEWRKGWEARGWLNSAKEPVANKDIWVQLFAQADLRKVTTRWVRGHSGDTNNERCDVLANEAISSGM
jgi:ribonuclease HI